MLVFPLDTFPMELLPIILVADLMRAYMRVVQNDAVDVTVSGYEPHKSRMSSTGWCGSKGYINAFAIMSDSNA